MRITHSTVLIALLLAKSLSYADFRYTQQSKVTGGTLVAMSKTLGAFSKSARQITDPQISNIMLKGNRMREEHAGSDDISIIDLDGRRFININSAKQTYSITTFDQFKAALLRAQQRAKEEQAKTEAKHPEVKLIPKFDVQTTGATRNVLGLTTNEMKMILQMEIQSDDPKLKEQMQNASYSFNSDAWIAPTVPGYSEVHQFYLKMAKELDWVPGAFTGVSMASPQMGPAMEEFRKNAAKLEGMPLLQYVSIGMSGMDAPAPQGGAPAPKNAGQPQEPAASESQNTSVPTNAKDAVSKTLGGMFGGFGKKKKQPDQVAAAPPTSSAATGNSAQPTTTSNSFLDMTVEVTSYSSGSLDPALFDVPAGYKQVQRDPDEMFGEKKR
jgi:hypothetical protein